MIRLEPRAIYDAAIIDQEGDRLVYCYNRLIDVLVEAIQEDQDISSDDAYYQAVDYISFNIEGMAINYKDWPIIKREDDEDYTET